MFLHACRLSGHYHLQVTTNLVRVEFHSNTWLRPRPPLRLLYMIYTMVSSWLVNDEMPNVTQVHVESWVMAIENWRDRNTDPLIWWREKLEYCSLGPGAGLNLWERDVEAIMEGPFVYDEVARFLSIKLMLLILVLIWSANT